MGNSPGFNWNQFPAASGAPKPPANPAGFDWNSFSPATATPQPAAPPATASAEPNPTTKTGFDWSQHPESAQEQPEATTWYGKSWDWLNKPLLDLHRQGAGGFEAGAEDVLSGLTSPLSAGLAIGTLGTGPLLEALGIGARELPVALQATRSLVDAGFTVQQVHGLVQQSPEFLDALKYGDYETAKRLGVNMLAGGAFAALGTRSVFSDFGTLAEKTGLRKGNEHVAAAREEFGKYQLDVEKAEGARRQLKDAALKGLDDPNMLPDDKPRFITAEERAAQVRTDQEKEFREWFGASKVRDPSGKPLRVYHGTRAGEDFTEFSTEGPPTNEEGSDKVTSSGDPNAYMGAHFAKEPEVAGKFAAGSEQWMKSRHVEGEEKPRVIPAYLKLENPVEFKSEEELQGFIYEGKLTGYEADALLNEAMRADGIHPEEDEEAADEWMQKYESDKDFRRDQNRWIFEDARLSDDEIGEHTLSTAAADLGSNARSRLRDFGHDGVVYKNRVEGGTSYIAFDPEQIRQALPRQREAATVTPAEQPAVKPPAPQPQPEEAKQWQTPEALKKFETENLEEKYTPASDTVGGLKVRDEVPNTDSIAASLNDRKVLKGIREVPVSDFSEMKYANARENQRVAKLADAIKESGEINPLIVVHDAEGSYVLEGGHRLAALQKLGIEKFPAMVVEDTESLAQAGPKKTLDVYKDDPERAAYYAKVGEQYQKNVIDKAPDVPEGKKPIAHVLLGGTASGKSTLTNALLHDNPHIISVNPDEAKLQVPEYEHLKAVDLKTAAAHVHDEAKLISKDILDRVLKAGKDFIYDATTSGEDDAGFIKDLQDRGYHVSLEGVSVPTDEALVREGVRAEISADPVNRGRYTPRERILKNHKGAVENWNKLNKIADEAHLHDNTGAEMRPIYSRLSNGDELWYDRAAHEDFQGKANGKEKRLFNTEEELQNEIGRRVAERRAAEESANRTAAAPAGNDAGGNGAVQNGVESTVREGAAGVRPAEPGVNAPDSGALPVAARGGSSLEEAAGQLTRKLGRKEKRRLLGAIFRWVDTGGDKERLAQQIDALKASSEFKENYSAKEQAEILARYDLARKLTPAQVDFAKRIRQNLEQDLEFSYQHGLVRQAHENYITHIWGEEPSTNEPVNTRKFQSNSGQFDTNVTFAKRRTFGSAFDGEVLGYKLKTDDPVELMANYRYKTAKAIAARDFMERLYDKGLRLPDGRAMVALSGSGETINDDERPSTFVDHNRMRSTRISTKMVAEMEKSGELQDHLTNGTIRQLAMESVRLPEKVQEQLRKNPEELQARMESGELKKAPGEDGEIFGVRPVYGWETGDYKHIDHPAFRGWQFATNAADGSPVFVKGDLRVHPDAAEFLKRAVGADRSPLRDLRIGDVHVGQKLMKLSSEAKHLTLSLSPFHLVQEGLRAVMTGINPFGKLDFDLEHDTALQQGVVHGLTLLRHPGELESYQEGVSSHSSVINKIPGLREIQGGLQHFLFDRYIPGLKARGYKSLFERYRAEYPEMSTSQAAAAAAAHTNEVFGGLNYAQMGRSLASQDAMRMGLLAPDWLESEVRLLHRAVDPKRGAIMRQDLARISLYTFAAARVLNLLTTGNAHPEAPFGVVLPGQKGQDDKVFSFRTLPVDMMHAMSDPRQFLAGRVNPLTVRPGIEGITGRDYFGRKVTPGQEFRDAVTGVVPIATQIPAKRLLNIQDVSNPEMVARMAGMSVNRYRTEAEKLAQEKASDRMPSGPVTDQELAAHQRNIRLEDMLRNGNVTPAQLRQQLPRTVAQNIIDGANLTPLQARFKRLPLADALEVWNMALPREKEELIGEMRKKRGAYLKSHHAQERAADPSWHKLQAVFGQ